MLQLIMIKLYQQRMTESAPPIKGIDISLDNIQLQQARPKNSNHKALLQENKFIKKQNQVLRRQLQKLSSRLDGQIKKRIDQNKKKSTSRSEDISQMQLQNAYKKCQIYKKEADHFKKRLQTTSDDRMQDFQRRINSYAKDNYQLKEEIKQLKKINKLQEKGLTELGIDGYSKIVGQNQKLKEEVRILKKQVDNYRRALQKNKTHSSQFESRNNDSAQERRPSNIKNGESRLEQRLKRKIKTQQNQTMKSTNNEDLNDLLQQKVEKDYHKLKVMANEKNKLRQLVDNLKFQLTEKDKETSMLKQKINDLRKNNQILQSQVIATRSESELIQSKVRKQRETSEKYPKGLRTKSIQRQEGSRVSKRVWKKDTHTEEEKQLPSQISKQSHYPRKQQRGSVMENTIKWSHQHLSSKIKEIQILRHQAGHIKDIHVRYEKGEPKKYDQSNHKLRYEIFSCSEDEYIKHIEGAFHDGYLQYLAITSNHRRVERYGNYEEYQHNQEAEAFEFEVNEKQYPGGLFGQSDENGIRKLGCLIHKEN